MVVELLSTCVQSPHPVSVPCPVATFTIVLYRTLEILVWHLNILLKESADLEN